MTIRFDFGFNAFMFLNSLNINKVHSEKEIFTVNESFV